MLELAMKKVSVITPKKVLVKFAKLIGEDLAGANIIQNVSSDRYKATVWLDDGIEDFLTVKYSTTEGRYFDELHNVKLYVKCWTKLPETLVTAIGSLEGNLDVLPTTLSEEETQPKA